MKDKLKLLKYLDEISIKENNDEYEIRLKDQTKFGKEYNDFDLVAYVDAKSQKASYYIQGIYNSGNDFAEINIEELKCLMTIVKELTK